MLLRRVEFQRNDHAGARSEATVSGLPFAIPGVEFVEDSGACGQLVEERAGVRGLGRGPPPDCGIAAVFKPAVVICNLRAVIDIDNRFFWGGGKLKAEQCEQSK